jgi:hypothetical protein
MKSRIQKFVPSSGKTTRNKLEKSIKSFIEDVFIEGSHIYDIDNITQKAENAGKCSSKWCKTCT